jgi:hypothetical protein
MFGLCANPPDTELHYQACIDNAHYMAKAPGLRLTKERSNNSARPCCRCFKHALSADRLGGTACYPNGRGCLFCYSQGKSLSRAEPRFRAEVARFRADPRRAIEALPGPYRIMVAPGADAALTGSSRPVEHAEETLRIPGGER